MLEGILRVARPDLACNFEKVVSCSMEVSGDMTDAFRTRGNTARRGVYTALIEDLAKAVGKVGLTTVRVELSRVVRPSPEQ